MKKRYILFNWTETKELVIGEFSNDDKFWSYYWENLTNIKAECSKLELGGMWYMDKF